VYAKYGRFKVGDQQAQYRLKVGSYSGTAGDSLAWHKNMAFTTKDKADNDVWGGNCAVAYTSAWTANIWEKRSEAAEHRGITSRTMNFHF